ncbi:MAG: AAA family ATPase [Lachnospiraceae bacterium]|nr:AAA family ATPase [Lachnospiraceae bacterium]
MEWYDDRNKFIRHEREPTKEAGDYKTPQQIYNYLNTRIWKQEEAKRAASMMMWKCLNGIKENVMFCGPSGSGKSEIFRQLKLIFPRHLTVYDTSNLTADGWKGDKKVNSLLVDSVGKTHNSIIVLDEFDKLLTPRFSHSENVSASIQSELLTSIEGATQQVTLAKDVTHEVHTQRISFAMCGAFSNLSEDVATKNKGASIGFGASLEAVKPYAKPLTAEDIIEFGALPELMGRIQRIVNLEPMTADDYTQMLCKSSHSPIQRLEDIYGIKLCLSEEKKLELAQNAYDSGLGVREITNQLTRMVDDVLFEDCETNYIELF